jgi:TonB-linked SusC/RagA family outer membrane protein
MKHLLYIVLIILLGSLTGLVTAQPSGGTITAAGIVMDENGEVLVGVSVYPKGNATAGIVTDLDGRFRIKNLPAETVLTFSLVGFDPNELPVSSSKEGLKIVLKPTYNKLDEVVVVGQGSQRKISVVGAITTIDPKELQIPATSITNMLGGRIAGIISTTASGEPGKDFSEFWIRGISTFGANSSALILIDGIEGNLNDLDPSDIESFSVLKDASATAVYGVRGANGVVIVTTQRGKAGKLAITFKSNATFSYSPLQPEYVNAITYAQLANEARVVRGLSPKYSETDLALYQSNLDPDLYPDVNWRDVILKKHTWSNQEYLSASGGGTAARYFLSLGVQNKDAIFKQDKSANKYNTNVDYHKYTFRANIDANLTKTTILALGVDQTIVNQNAPGYGTTNDGLWQSQASLTPVTVPVIYSNGQLPAYGTNANQISPYVLLNYSGYKQFNRNSTKVNVTLRQDLSAITKGLEINSLFSYDANGFDTIFRRKMPNLYFATGRYNDGSLNTKNTFTKQDISYNRISDVDRQYYFEFRANYQRTFGVNRVTALVHYYMQDFKSSTATTDIQAIPQRYQAVSGRATYSYNDIYFAEANAGYTGSENFKPGYQFGLFPAIAIGWVPTQYDWVKNNITFIDFFKFRASVGKVGNDRISNSRFPYMTIMGYNSSASQWGGLGLTETTVGSNNLQWETAIKYNLGMDVHVYHDRFELTTDIFKDYRSGIFQQRVSIPDEVGAVAAPYTNVGSMWSSGIDGSASFLQPINKDLSVTLRGNFTFSHNEVTHWDQSGVRYPYQSYSGVPYGVLRGLLALGLFKDEADVASSPTQTFMSNVLPGDIKYKDVNGDGKINADDVVPLSYSNTPQIQYGFATEIKYKRWTISAFFEGTGKVNFFYGGTGYYPFSDEGTGNILTKVADQANRWTPASYSGTTATENPNASFPRLTYGSNANNNQASTFWLADSHYLRFKNMEISYRWDGPWLKSLGVQAATFSLVGDNLAVWSPVKLWDPGQASSNGAVYPLQRAFTCQLNLLF